MSDGDASGAKAALARSLADSYLEAIRTGDDEGSLAVLERAISSSLGAPSFYLDVVQPALERIGGLWECGVLDVGEEHRATEMTRRIMDALDDEFSARPRRAKGGPLLAGCVRGEQHELGLTMVVRFLRRDGWPVVALGANVPESSFALMAGRAGASACLLSLATRDRLDATRATVGALRASGFRGPVLVGGSLFRRESDGALATDLGANGYASDAAEVVKLVRALLPNLAPSS